MSKSLITRKKKPAPGQISIIGRHAEDAAKAIVNELKVSKDEFQLAIVENADLQRAFQKVLQLKVKAYRLATEPHILQRKPFDLEKFPGLGVGWKIDERIGQRDRNILDASQIYCKEYVKESEPYINGEEYLRRIKGNQTDSHLDEEDFFALYKEDGQETLRWLYKTKRITDRLFFWGSILIFQSFTCTTRDVLYLSRKEDGTWDWHLQHVSTDGCYYHGSNPPGVLVSS